VIDESCALAAVGPWESGSCVRSQLKKRKKNTKNLLTDLFTSLLDSDRLIELVRLKLASLLLPTTPSWPRVSSQRSSSPILEVLVSMLVF
jgi:hypothetical protein